MKRNRFAGHAIGSSSLHRADAGGEGAAGGKVKLLCHEPFYLKVPAYPIPRSWLKPVAKLDARTVDQYKGYHYEERDILSMRSVNDFFYSNNEDKVYRAVLMDPPFDLSSSPVHIQVISALSLLDQPISTIYHHQSLIFRTNRRTLRARCHWRISSRSRWTG